MSRDLSEEAALTQQQERILEDMSDEALEAFLKRKHQKAKGKKKEKRERE